MQSFPAALRIAQSVPTLAGADGLAGINTNLFSPNAIVMVQSNNSLYVLRKTSVAVASSPDIIAPDSGPGRWFLYSAGAQGFQSVNLGVPALGANSGAEVSGVAVTGVADSDDVVVFNLLTSGTPTGLAITSPRVTGPGTVAFHVLNGTGATIAGGTYSLRVAVLSSP